MRTLLLALVLVPATLAEVPEGLSDPEATPETRAVFENLKKIAAQPKMLVGHQNTNLYGSGWSGNADRSDVKSAVGVYPALYGYDLPKLLVFEEDLQARRDAEHHLLIALAHHGLGDPAQAEEHLSQTLSFTLTDQRAADLAHSMGNHSTDWPDSRQSQGYFCTGILAPILWACFVAVERCQPWAVLDRW